jgi:hypothetical protein
MLLGLAAGCSGKADTDVLAEVESRAAADAQIDGKVACAIGGASNFSQNCVTEQLSSAEGSMLIIRHADGGFRRFNIVPGRGVETADGAEPAKVVVVNDGLIEVSVGNDRYRLPARMRPGQGSAAASAAAPDDGPETPVSSPASPADNAAAISSDSPGSLPREALDLSAAEKAGVRYRAAPAQ